MPKSIAYGQPTIVLASAARTTSSNSGSLKDTANVIPVSDSVALYLNVTALTGAGPAVTFECWVDTSVDGGTTWFTAYKWTSVTTSTATRRITCRTNGIGPAENGWECNAATSVTAVTTSNTVLAADHRIRWEINGATSAGTATFAVYALAQPPGSASY